MSEAVDITNPVPPDWYEAQAGPDALSRCVELVRNGNAVFWRSTQANGRPDYGLFLPGSGYTPEGATLYAPPPGRAGLTLPGLVQYDPGAEGYPHVTTGAVLLDLTNGTLAFRIG